MKRINVMLEDENWEFLDNYKKSNKLKSLDDAINHNLKYNQKEKKK